MNKLILGAVTLLISFATYAAISNTGVATTPFGGSGSGAATSLKLANNASVVWRNHTDTGDVNGVTLDNFGRLVFAGEAGTNIVWNNSFIPPSASTLDIGTDGDEFRDIFITGFNVKGSITAIGTTGSITNSVSSGTVNIAAGASTATVTNTKVTVNSIVLCTIRTADTTAILKNCVPAAGSFVVNFTANATAATSVGFLVVNQ